MMMLVYFDKKNRVNGPVAYSILKLDKIPDSPVK